MTALERQLCAPGHSGVDFETRVDFSIACGITGWI